MPACSFAELDGIAAAAGPGLIGGVIVGLTTAKAIALVAEKPLIAVNHLEAHALTARLTDATPFPYCLFLASGGHTQIVAVLGVGDYVRLGTTVDDAIGEAFDKTAKLLGLGYPGGPQVEREAARGNADRFTLPRPMLGRKHADFSLSGLKTALRLEAEKIAPLADGDVRDLCAAFQQARGRCRRRPAARRPRRCSASASASRPRWSRPAASPPTRRSARRCSGVAFEAGTVLVVPPPALCTDNGAMIAWAGAERLALGLTDTLDAPPHARWPLSDVTGPPKAEAVGDRPRPSPAPTRKSRGKSCAAMTFDRIAVVGAGAWGIALASAIARAGRAVRARHPRPRRRRRADAPAREPAAAGRAARRAHRRRALMPRSAATTRSCWRCRRSSCARPLRSVAPQLRRGTPVIACAKGIERSTPQVHDRGDRRERAAARCRRSCRDRASPPTWRAGCRWR